jgi:mannose-6-phosphate isomerase-like protein (cupin superfamily)
MAGYTLANLKEDVEDSAPGFGFAPDLEAHFARRTLGLEQSGVAYERYAPNFRLPFGHSHREQEEVVVVIAGGGRMKVEDELVDLKQFDAVRIAPGTWRGTEAGPDGLEIVVFGARPGMGPDDDDADMKPGWWSD